MPNSDKFKDKQIKNIKSKIKSKKFPAHAVKLGAFSIDIDPEVRNIGRLVPYKQLYLKDKYVPMEDPDGIWSYDKNN